MFIRLVEKKSIFVKDKNDAVGFLHLLYIYFTLS